MNTQDERSYEIVNGPNKDTLFDACKYAYGKTKVIVNFSIVAGYTPSSHTRIPMLLRDITICGIEHEDGSGESFNLHGHCKVDGALSTRVRICRFKAYYNARSRKGFITFN